MQSHCLSDLPYSIFSLYSDTSGWLTQPSQNPNKLYLSSHPQLSGRIDIQMRRETLSCVLCRKLVREDQAHNPHPLAEEGRCCGECNKHVVMARAQLMVEYYQREEAREAEQ